MKNRVTDTEVSAMLKKPKRFNKNGINFLRCRLNGGEQGHAESVIGRLNKGELSIPEGLKEEVKKAYGFVPSAEGVAVILLGRAPTGVKDASMVGSVSSTPTAEQITVAGKLAKSFTDGHLYKNRARLSKDKVPTPSKEEKPAAKVDTPPTVEKKPSVAERKKAAAEKRKEAKQKEVEKKAAAVEAAKKKAATAAASGKPVQVAPTVAKTEPVKKSETA